MPYRWIVVVVLLLLAAGVLLPAVGALRRREDRRRRMWDAIEAGQARESELASGRAEVATMTGPQFERFVAALLERDGCTAVDVSGGAGDRGADVTAISPYGWRVVVQCKRYGPGRPVGDPDMQRFLGTVRDEHRAEIAMFVTTSRFTKAARELGTRRHVVLVDGERLAEWRRDGPRSSPVPREPLDDSVL